jgi:hypothetical protein
MASGFPFGTGEVPLIDRLRAAFAGIQNTGQVVPQQLPPNFAVDPATGQLNPNYNPQGAPVSQDFSNIVQSLAQPRGPGGAAGRALQASREFGQQQQQPATGQPHQPPLFAGPVPDPNISRPDFQFAGGVGPTLDTLGPATPLPAPNFDAVRAALGTGPEPIEPATKADQIMALLGGASAGALRGGRGRGDLGTVLAGAGAGGLGGLTELRRHEEERERQYQQDTAEHHRNLADLEAQALGAKSEVDMFNLNLRRQTELANLEIKNAQAKADAPIHEFTPDGKLFSIITDPKTKIRSVNLSAPYLEMQNRQEAQIEMIKRKAGKIWHPRFGGEVDASVLPSPTLQQAHNIVVSEFQQAQFKNPEHPLHQQISAIFERDHEVTLQEAMIRFGSVNMDQDVLDVMLYDALAEILVPDFVQQLVGVGATSGEQ